VRTIVLIADCSAKKPIECRRADMFTSPMFRASLAYARHAKPDARESTT
jgi:hypothetical protein